MMETIPLSQALPEEKDREDLKPGMEFAISGIIIFPREKRKKDGTVDKWNTAHINGFLLPDLDKFIKVKSSAGAVVRKCMGLLSTACYTSGECKKPVRVRVIQAEGVNGPYLDLEDA